MKRENEILSQVLAKYMKEENIKNWQFAKKVGITQALLSRYLHGVTFPSFSTIQKISEKTGIPIKDLLGL